MFVRPVRLCGMVLPFDLTVRQSIGMQTQTVALSEEKAEYFAMQQLEEWEAQHPEYQVQRRLLRKTQKEGRWSSRLATPSGRTLPGRSQS